MMMLTSCWRATCLDCGFEILNVLGKDTEVVKAAVTHGARKHVMDRPDHDVAVVSPEGDLERVTFVDVVLTGGEVTRTMPQEVE